jgi:Zn-dependent protease
MDVRFRLFGVPVCIHPLFWLISAMLGWGLVSSPVISDNGMLDLAIWILACFLWILLHEFGHVWMWQAFGVRSHILLHSMGGLAIPSTGTTTKRWQHILVSAAGPGIQLLLFAVLVALLYLGVLPFPDVMFRRVGGFLSWLGVKPQEVGWELSPPLGLLLAVTLEVNLFWPLLNLLPIWPLDGGQITREACAMASPQKGVLTALWISLVVSGVLAVNALVGMKGGLGKPFIPYAPGGMWIAILFAIFAVGSWQAIQIEQQNQRGSGYDDQLPWER